MPLLLKSRWGSDLGEESMAILVLGLGMGAGGDGAGRETLKEENEASEPEMVLVMAGISRRCCS
jgi:hypothetical protein